MRIVKWIDGIAVVSLLALGSCGGRVENDLEGTSEGDGSIKDGSIDATDVSDRVADRSVPSDVVDAESLEDSEAGAGGSSHPQGAGGMSGETGGIVLHDAAGASGGSTLTDGSPDQGGAAGAGGTGTGEAGLGGAGVGGWGAGGGGFGGSGKGGAGVGGWGAGGGGFGGSGKGGAGVGGWGAGGIGVGGWGAGGTGVGGWGAGGTGVGGWGAGGAGVGGWGAGGTGVGGWGAGGTGVGGWGAGGIGVGGWGAGGTGVGGWGAGGKPDAGPTCKLSSSGAGPCEAQVLFSTVSVSEGTVCPSGADVVNDVCVGHGTFANTNWTTTDGRTLSGTIGVRVARIPVSVTIPLLGTVVCDFAIGGSTFVDVPVQIVLPQGTSASGFIPGCTPVSGEQITVGSVSPSLTSSSTTCELAKSLAEAAGALSSLADSLETLIANALEGQICLNR